MEIENKKKMGCWDTLDTGDIRPKVEFELGKTEVVTFEVDNPREVKDKKGEGVFYVFDCSHNGEKKSIVTSAITLLVGLKKIEEECGLEGKTLEINKKQNKQKQLFRVELQEEETS